MPKPLLLLVTLSILLMFYPDSFDVCESFRSAVACTVFSIPNVHREMQLSVLPWSVIFFFFFISPFPSASLRLFHRKSGSDQTKRRECFYFFFFVLWRFESSFGRIEKVIFFRFHSIYSLEISLDFTRRKSKVFGFFRFWYFDWNSGSKIFWTFF